MLDAATKAQLKSYLERATQPIEIVASLDDSKASGELQALLKDIMEASPLVKVRRRKEQWFPGAGRGSTNRMRLLPVPP